MSAGTEGDGMDIAYVIDGRVPSNNGYVLQTVQMCEGFECAGHDVTLTHSRRTQTNPDLVGVDVYDYFDVDDRFAVRSLPYPDPEAIPALFGGRFYRPLRWIASFWFAVVAVLVYRFRPADLHVTRDWLVAYVFVRAGLPTVFEVHKLAGTSFSPRGRSALVSVADRSALRAVVTLTEPTADGLADYGVPREKILVEPDAVDLSRYEEPLSKDEARESLGLAPDEDYVGYTGSLHPGKGARTLVEACADLDATVLLLGGTDDSRGQMQSVLEERGIENVRLLGRVEPSAVPTYQWACDVLALPPTAAEQDRKHHPEATSPLKLFEYMAAGRPIVASTLPGIESVLTDGENGLLVAPGDATAFADAVERLLSDEPLRDRLSENARETVREYTWERRAARIAAFAAGDVNQNT